MKTTNYIFEVQCLEAGQRKPYGDSYFSYEVTSDRPEDEVKDFCMNVLRKSYEQKDMPDWASGRLLEFSRTTNNNEGKSFFDDRVKEKYSYKLKTSFTD